MILYCECKHSDQDQYHGKGNRVHNGIPEKTGKKTGNKIVKARCTVCGHEKELNRKDK